MGIKIMLDAGHYGKYNRSPVNKNYYESVMAWKYHLLLKAELEHYGFEVKTTRKTIYENLDTYPRGLSAEGCDVFLSLHSNACDDPAVDRVEVYYAYDNRNNAIVLAKSLADEIAKIMNVSYGVPKTRESKEYPGNEYYGVMRGARKAGVPLYFILEHSFHTNAKAAEFLILDDNLKVLAKSTSRIIAEYCGIKTAEFESGDVNGDGDVNAKDYMMLKKGVLGTRPLTDDEKSRSDVNNDGKIDAKDYMQLKRKILSE